MDTVRTPGFTAELSLHGGPSRKYFERPGPGTGQAGGDRIAPQLIHGCRCYGTLHCYPPPIAVLLLRPTLPVLLLLADVRCEKRSMTI
jgi:hypothetical protein